MPRGSGPGRGGGSTRGRRRVAHAFNDSEGSICDENVPFCLLILQLEHLLDEHREGMVVRTGLRCHHDLYPILSCSWSGSDAGRTYLACPQVLQPCSFKYWIDQEFSGRARRVIEDLVSMK
ncbi:hypothetical protein PVAP13_3NG080008 [Panicum virgatum]|uniref:Uncharacterized protein n=1 Tax=Panicum virgatum TaxID=38727 RepID=A0A8T0U7P0_PANVG|nr:hypothetical protein PVAP13_3NG080008 [Panicum virgatum]